MTVIFKSLEILEKIIFLEYEKLTAPGAYCKTIYLLETSASCDLSKDRL